MMIYNEKQESLKKDFNDYLTLKNECLERINKIDCELIKIQGKLELLQEFEKESKEEE